MKTGINGLDLIKSFEGFKASAYLCPASVWTLGYGHTKNVVKGQVVTEQQGVELLKSDLLDAENAVNSYKLNLNQNQFDALVSFVFNCGAGNFAKSTLLKKLKLDPNNASITIEFLKWNRGGGKVLNGLTRRRNAESDLYFKAV